MLLCVGMSCLFFVALWSPAGKGLTSWLSCVLCFVTFPKCVLVHLRIKGEVGAMKLVYRSKAVLLLCIFYVVFFPVLCLLCLCARLFICALWSPAGKGLTSWLSFMVYNCEFSHFPIGILGQMWY